MRWLLVVLLGCSGVPVGPDAALPSLRVIWPPQTCRERIQVRVEDRDGRVEVAEAPCGEGALEVEVDHVGWYVASALVAERAIATATLAIDGPAVTWRLPW